MWVVSLIYALLAGSSISFEEVFSVWAVSTRGIGGLAFSSEEVAIMFLVLGVFYIIAQFLNPPLIRRFGPLQTFKIFTCYFMVFTILFPFLRLFVSYGKGVVMVACGILIALRAIMDIVSFTSVTLLVNHSVEPDLIGTANGIAQSTTSFARTLGPLLSGLALSWGMSNGIGFPFDQYFIFFVLGIVFVISVILSCILPPTINVRKKFPTQTIEETN